MQSHSFEIIMKPIIKRLPNTLRNYYLYHIDENFDANEESKIIQKVQESNLVIIDEFPCEGKSDISLVIGFHKTIIIIKDSSINLLKRHFANKAQLKFYFLHNSKDIFDKNNSITEDQIFKYSDKFDEEIISFNRWFEIRHPQQMQNRINSCISGYLLGESYFNLIEEQKIDFTTAFKIDSNQKEREKSNIKEWREEDYVKLRQLDIGSLFETELIYQIDTGRLLVVKKQHLDDKEVSKLYKRECKNYLEINYPLIPKFYGKQKEKKCFIIQYIHGQTLNNVDVDKLKLEDKIKIMIELMLIIKYLHDKKFVYRDLKPNNVIIDSNRTAFLIDFDRMIKLDSLKDHTKDFATKFAAKEVNSGEISYENDIYSIGMIIEYLGLSKENDKINTLYQNCTNYTANERPSIFLLIIHFYLIIIQHFNKIFTANFTEIQYLQGIFYSEGKYITRDINKSIHYFSLAANQNDPIAQNILGAIYYEGKYISRDINKSIHYLSLAANQTN